MPAQNVDVSPRQLFFENLNSRFVHRAFDGLSQLGLQHFEFFQLPRECVALIRSLRIRPRSRIEIDSGCSGRRSDRACSRSPSPSRRSIGTSHSSSGIPWPLTPAAACSSDSAPSAIRPRAALRKYVVNCALLRSSTRSRRSASGSVAARVSLPFLVFVHYGRGANLALQSGVPFSMVSSSDRCSSDSASTRKVRPSGRARGYGGRGDRGVGAVLKSWRFLINDECGRGGIRGNNP